MSYLQIVILYLSAFLFLTFRSPLAKPGPLNTICPPLLSRFPINFWREFCCHHHCSDHRHRFLDHKAHTAVCILTQFLFQQLPLPLLPYSSNPALPTPSLPTEKDLDSSRRSLSEQTDIHARLMSVSKEVPDWWDLLFVA